MRPAPGCRLPALRPSWREPLACPPRGCRHRAPPHPPRRAFPGEIEKIRTWFQDYKVPDGKPKNKFGYDDKPQNKEFTLHVIQETHEAYKALKSGKRENDEQLALA